MNAVESSTVVAFRAMVMLACLIFVPLAAIFGSAFPEVVRSVLIDPIMGNKPAAPSQGPEVSVSMPGSGYAPSAGPSAEASSLAPVWQASQAPPLNSAPGLPTDAAEMGRVGAPRDLQYQAGNLQPVDGPERPAALAHYVAPPELAPPPAWRPGSEARPLAPVGALTRGSDAPFTQSASSPQTPDRLIPLEKKLRDLGATYYLLETWGSDGELYRFHCKMAIANNPNYTRHFEATDRDKYQAMTKVLEQIEASRRLP